ncbi:MAG: tetratricopeptide repeat protein [Xanthobacteraceae bacterium]
MGGRRAQALLATLTCLLWLNGCETSTKLGSLLQPSSEATEPSPTPMDLDGNETGTTAGVPPGPGSADDAPKGLLGNDPKDGLSLGKKYFRSANFGLAERHFRRAVEQHPRDVEAWNGLAASYDRLRRWDLADRAYAQAMKIAGPQAELLNNWGYSYMLRGDYRRAQETLLQAQVQDPANPYIKNNLELLDVSYRKGKAVQ